MGAGRKAPGQQVQVRQPQVRSLSVDPGTQKGFLILKFSGVFLQWVKLDPAVDTVSYPLSQKPNCKVRLVMVDGDWRVAVNANRNIAPNEELFYDYR